MSGECAISQFCLITTKIWSDGPALKPSDRPCHSSRTDQCYSSVFAAQFYLENKGKYILEAWGHDDPKDAKKREGREREQEREPRPLAPLFIHYFFLPLGQPYVNWASQECCLFCLRSSLWSSYLPLFYFLFPSLSFSHCHSGLLFPILTT